MADLPNYVDKIVAELELVLNDCDVDLLRYYALLALTLGAAVTEDDVHDAWSMWRTATKPDHASLVPFSELAPEVQALDTIYADAVRAVAKKITAGEG